MRIRAEESRLRASTPQLSPTALWTDRTQAQSVPSMKAVSALRNASSESVTIPLSPPKPTASSASCRGSCAASNPVCLTALDRTPKTACCTVAFASPSCSTAQSHEPDRLLNLFKSMQTSVLPGSVRPTRGRMPLANMCECTQAGGISRWSIIHAAALMNRGRSARTRQADNGSAPSVAARTSRVRRRTLVAHRTPPSPGPYQPPLRPPYLSPCA